MDTKNSKKQLASKEQEVTFPQTEVVPAKHGKDEEVDEKNDIVMKICSAKVRARPPQLVISKNSEKAKPWSRPLSLSPLPMAELATPAYTKKDTFDEGQSIPLLKKISSLPLSEIEKVNQLLVTHYRLEDKAKEVSLSYKLKIVILMTIIGVFFMLYDTIGDRSLRRKALITKVQKKPGKGEKEKQEGQEKKEKKGKGDNDKGKNKDKPRKKDKGSRKAPSNDV